LFEVILFSLKLGQVNVQMQDFTLTKSGHYTVQGLC